MALQSNTEFNIYSFILHILVFFCLCLVRARCIYLCICLSSLYYDFGGGGGGGGGAFPLSIKDPLNFIMRSLMEYTMHTIYMHWTVHCAMCSMYS